MTLKMAVLAPIPSASVATVIAVNKGVRASRRATGGSRILATTQALGESLRFLPQSHDGRAPATRFERRIAERSDEIRARQNRAHRFPLHADATAVNDAQGTETELTRLDE